MHFKTNFITNHVKENMTVYIFTTTLFLTGIIFGAIIVNSMTFIQKEDLFFHLDRFFMQISGDETIARTEILKSSMMFHFKYVGLFLILGLTIIGLPILWILTFIKGLVIGFSVGFIVNQLGFNGLVIATFSIAPHNIIVIPVYIIASSVAMIFSLILMHKLFVRTASQSIVRPFVQYITVFTVLFIFACVSSLVETYISNEVFKAFLRSSYLSLLG